MRRKLTQYFNIDDLGRGGGISKLLFASMVILRWAVYFCPVGDSDFTPLMNWYVELLKHPEVLDTADHLEIPVSSANLLYLIFVLGVNLMCVYGTLLYLGLFIRQRRLGSEIFKSRAISESSIIFRTFWLGTIGFIVFVPFSIILLFLFLIFIIIVPCLIVFPACYMSGDEGLTASLRKVMRIVRSRYFDIARPFSMLAFAYLMLDLVLRFAGAYSPAVMYLLEPFAAVYVMLAAARISGIVYCDLADVVSIRVNDAQGRAPKQS